MRSVVVCVGIIPFMLMVAAVTSLTHATATTIAAPEVRCTSQDQLQACATSAKWAAIECCGKDCACSELPAYDDCYYKYCPGFGGAYGGGIVNSFTCAGTTPASGFPTASSNRAASGEATQTDSHGVASSSTESSGGLGGGNTESTVTPAPTPPSTGNSGSSNSDQPAATSTNDTGMLFASAGALLGSLISVLAWL